MSEQEAGAAQGANHLAALVGDADRDLAVDHLTQHHVEGRLTSSELDERLGLALGARTVGDLDAATRDLPVRQASGGTPVRHRGAAPRGWGARHRVGLAAVAASLGGVCAWWFG